MGVYKKNEFPHYFALLRKLLLEKYTLIHVPIVLNLESPDHAINVVYYPISDRWHLIDINQFPRNENEAQEFFYASDFTIAEAVAKSFIVPNDYVMFETKVYSVLENWYQPSPVKNTHIIKNLLIEIFDKWVEKLAPFHKITPEKAIATVHDNGSLLYLAVQRGETRYIKDLIEMKADINSVACKGTNPILRAAYYGYTRIMHCLLTSGQKIDINKQSIEKNTPLMLSVALEHEEITHMLLEAKNVLSPINPNLINKTGDGPLHAAAAIGNIALTQLLLNTEFKEHPLDINKADSKGETPLYIAIEEGHSDIAKKLLSVNTINVNIQSTQRLLTPLMLSIITKQTNLIEFILETKTLNCDTNQKDSYENVALHHAVKEKQPNIVEILIKHHANPNIMNVDGFTPLHFACKDNEKASVHELLRCSQTNPNLFKNNPTAIFEAAKKGYIDIVLMLLNYNANPNLYRPWDGATPIYMAAQLGHYETVKLLLQYQADPTITLLMEGDTVKYYPNGEYPPSPLEIAAKRGHIEIVKLLSSYQATSFIKSNPCDTVRTLERCAYESKVKEDLQQGYTDYLVSMKNCNTKKQVNCQDEAMTNCQNKTKTFNQAKGQDKTKTLQQTSASKNVYTIKQHTHLGRLFFSPIEKNTSVKKAYVKNGNSSILLNYRV
ncbi:MAG: ankyrin repeat domain-containing protein [Gammaproteobacteria bacterium]|nr:ankyrin repeat domain-containing protein [Gammaproteobacteria bacterium]